MNKDKRRNKKINTTSFSKYFTLKVGSKELSDNYIMTILNLWNKSDNVTEEIKTTFFELRKGKKLSEFINKIYTIFLPEISPDLAESLIEFIYKNSKIFSNERHANFGGSEYDKAVYLILWLINERMKDKIQKKLEEITLNTPDINLAARLVLLCKKERQGDWHNIYNIVNFEELTSKVSKRLEQHFINDKKDIFNELKNESIGLVLYQWATNWGRTTQSGNKKIVNDYLKLLVGKDINEFIALLKIFIKNDGYSDKPSFSLTDFNKVCSIETFHEIANNLAKKNELPKEAQEMIELFLEKVETNKIKVLYFEPVGTNFETLVKNSNWKIARNEQELLNMANYNVVILFLHEEVPKQMGNQQGLNESIQQKIVEYVKNGGYLIAFHDVLYVRNRILADKLCGYFKGAVIDKEGDIEVKAMGLHPISQNLPNFKIKDEKWAKNIEFPLNSGEQLTFLFKSADDQPLIWLKGYGKGEILVISLGHKKELINDVNIQKIIFNAIDYFSNK